MFLDSVSYDEFEWFTPDDNSAVPEAVWEDEVRRQRRVSRRRLRRPRPRRTPARRRVLRRRQRRPVNRFPPGQQHRLRRRKRIKGRRPRRPKWRPRYGPASVSVNVQPWPPFQPPEPPIDYPEPGMNGGGAMPPPAEPPPEQGSEFVRRIQSTLNVVMRLNLPVDGIMSPVTRSAIRTFQERQGLVVDGIVGPDTKAALITARQRNGRTQPSANREPDAPEEEYFLDVVWERFKKPQGMVSRRSRSYIGWVQQALNKIMGQRLTVDGISGPKTSSAVRDFQRRKGLAVDGVVGSRTEAALIAAGAGQPPRSKAPRPGRSSGGNGRLASSAKP